MQVLALAEISVILRFNAWLETKISGRPLNKIERASLQLCAIWRRYVNDLENAKQMQMNIEAYGQKKGVSDSNQLQVH